MRVDPSTPACHVHAPVPGCLDLTIEVELLIQAGQAVRVVHARGGLQSIGRGRPREGLEVADSRIETDASDARERPQLAIGKHRELLRGHVGAGLELRSPPVVESKYAQVVGDLSAAARVIVEAAVVDQLYFETSVE